MRRRFIQLAGLAFTSVLLTACGGGDDPPPRASLAATAQAQGFTALVAAADKAGLVGVLNDPTSELTVLGPTDAAFETLATRLGFASATDMVAALDADTLQKILQYHVLPGRLTAADIAGGGATQATLYSFEDSPATLAVKTGAGVRFGDAVLTDATVTIADVRASNGVFHAIDKVLVPPGLLTVVQMAQANPAFSSLVGAVVSAGLVGALDAATPAAPITVFAPVDAAFAALPAVPAGDDLVTVLTYHVVPGQVLSSDIPFGAPVGTLASQDIVIDAGTPPAIATITDTTATPANVVAVDVRARNGVIHVIDRVLIPAL